MKLYTHMDRVRREIQARGLGGTADPEALSAVDSLHYGGNEAIRHGVATLGLMAGQSVLDIGSGLGGPARLMAKWVPNLKQVLALELQPDLHELAESLTRQCNLASTVTHVNGNILTYRRPQEPFDAITSWLVFLHIPDKRRLLRACRGALKPGGKMLVADYCRRPGNESTMWTSAERLLLQNDVFVEADTLSSPEEYRTLLEEHQFDILEWTDASAEWQTLVQERAASYQKEYERHVLVHGSEAAASLGHFYQAVDTLFAGGRLGGVVYLVRKSK